MPFAMHFVALPSGDSMCSRSLQQSAISSNFPLIMPVASIMQTTEPHFDGEGMQEAARAIRIGTVRQACVWVQHKRCSKHDQLSSRLKPIRIRRVHTARRCETNKCRSRRLSTHIYHTLAYNMCTTVFGNAVAHKLKIKISIKCILTKTHSACHSLVPALVAVVDECTHTHEANRNEMTTQTNKSN